MNEETKISETPGEIANPLMTKPEVAALLKKSHRTIEHWVNQGYITAIRIGHSVLFEREQLLRDLRRFKSGPSTDKH